VDDDVPVLIAGGSLVGLSTALFLGWHGIPSLVVERHRGTAIHPRAALVNQRTIELYRSVGLEPAIREASELEFVQNGAIVSVESLAGRELEYYFRNINEGVEGLSPSPRLFITQIGLEPILLQRSQELGASIAWGTELVSFDADADGVTARVRERDGGAEREVRARYLVAADGSHSPVRRQLGIPLSGHGSFSNSITIYFRADVRPLVGDRNLSVIYVFGPTQQGFFRFSKAGDAGFLVVNKALGPDGALTTNLWDDTGDERCVALVREALGAPDLIVEVENVQRWNACAEWAERFDDGRVFLAGDAAHNMPPTGGFGGNVGVQDGHNLAWKLALHLGGAAGPELLSTYDLERRPVGAFSVEQAYTRYVLRLAPELGKEHLQPIVPEAAVELGYRYRSPAVLTEPDDDEDVSESPFEPTARPGTRAPHVEVPRDGRPVSTIDLLGRGFTVLAGGDGDGWCRGAESAAAELGVAMDAHKIEDDGRFAEIYRTGTAGAVLVRPDGFIAWRTALPADDAERVLGDTLAQVLARSS
jgi:2-polyprenyl-6-methoxyphenol hydroxylase-like FAD-dependent oxidoreductase